MTIPSQKLTFGERLPKQTKPQFNIMLYKKYVYPRLEVWDCFRLSMGRQKQGLISLEAFLIDKYSENILFELKRQGFGPLPP